MTATQQSEARLLTISGQVQGVGFRWAMQQQALRCGATGWVRNRRDGSVEALVAGTPEAMAQMIVWARHGPPDARVDHVSVELAVGAFTDFEQRPTASA